MERIWGIHLTLKIKQHDGYKSRYKEIDTYFVSELNSLA